MIKPAPPSLAIDTRFGWPPELRLLLEEYPREVWEEHVNLGQMARFWLDIHNNFRAHGRSLERTALEFREGLLMPQRFREVFAPRLQTFLNHLNGHHQIEDFQFFPVFGEAEPRLLTGFDVLENDHEAIHHVMDRMAETANGFMKVDSENRDAMMRAGEAYVGASEAMVRMLARHLDDEEDLIIPLILDRTEGALGI